MLARRSHDKLPERTGDPYDVRSLNFADSAGTRTDSRLRGLSGLLVNPRPKAL